MRRLPPWAPCADPASFCATSRQSRPLQSQDTTKDENAGKINEIIACQTTLCVNKNGEAGEFQFVSDKFDISTPKSSSNEMFGTLKCPELETESEKTGWLTHKASTNFEHHNDCFGRFFWLHRLGNDG